MIDFRYHLVSTISIFLALAVGIVLGAGPLQANLGTQLTEQVSALRTEKQLLHDQLDASEKLVTAADEYSVAVGRRVVKDRLVGHSVALIVLPSADGSLVSNLESAVAASGAKRTATLTISPDWFDPSQAIDRGDAAREAGVALGLPAGGNADTLLVDVLARLAVSTSGPTAPPGAQAALDALTEAGIIDTSSDELTPADLVVIISGDFAGTESFVNERASSVRAIIRALGSGSSAAVVAGPGPVVAAGQPVTADAVTAVRDDDDTAAEVSTVDHARDGSGPTIVVLALEAELDEHIGHYGTSKGATAAVPRILP